MVIVACLFFILAIGALIISILSFYEKGFLFNNAYIYASKTERKSMDKKPYYRQSAIMFSAVALCMLLIGIAILVENAWLICIAVLLSIAALFYVIATDMKIEKQKKQ